jgi:hypothetical protein
MEGFLRRMGEVGGDDGGIFMVNVLCAICGYLVVVWKGELDDVPFAFCTNRAPAWELLSIHCLLWKALSRNES